MTLAPLESDEQAALCRWLDEVYLDYFAVPNGGSRHKIEAINLQRQGVKKGVPDLVVFTNRKILFVEMKRRDKRLSTTSKEQKDFLKKLSNYQYAVGSICYGCEDARNFISKYL